MSSDYNRDDLQSIQRQIDEKNTSMFDTTDRILTSLHDSEALGNNALDQLVQDGERLQNIVRSCDATDATLIQTQGNINKLSSRFGGLKNFFRPPKSAFHKSASQPQLSDTKKKKSNSADTNTTTSQSVNSIDDTATYLGIPRSQMNVTQQKTEENLYYAHQGVGRLKELAQQMNLEIEDQKPIIESLTQKVGDLHDTTKRQNKQMRKIVQS
jgi:hypothetical protein